MHIFTDNILTITDKSSIFAMSLIKIYITHLLINWQIYDKYLRPATCSVDACKCGTLEEIPCDTPAGTVGGH